ncbi:MAG: ArsR family transcriptional regulator, arsenate/arsenite/antimonite-responsive transcriptional [Sphingomonadales bacterium]|nr:ArsR family transcriptional regulator, arsenate/arsenite/antimonite-responsive transcriptional [Sphingomonadales bacterium]
MMAMQMMSALAQPTRLSVFTILAGQQPGGLSAGDIAARSKTPPNTMSAHLAILNRAGLVTSSKQGRVVTYTACPSAVRDLCAFLRKACSST